MRRPTIAAVLLLLLVLCNLGCKNKEQSRALPPEWSEWLLPQECQWLGSRKAPAALENVKWGLPYLPVMLPKLQDPKQMQVSLTIDPSDVTYRTGSRLKIRFFFKNVSSQKIVFHIGQSSTTFFTRAFDTTGVYYDLHVTNFVEFYCSPPAITDFTEIGPGNILEGAINVSQVSWKKREAVFQEAMLPHGKYVVTVLYFNELNGFRDGSNQFRQFDNCFTGLVISNSATLRIWPFHVF
jgi:hypothetical protein